MSQGEQEAISVNYQKGLVVNASNGDRTPVVLWADKTTHRLLVDANITLDNVDIPTSQETSTIFNGITPLTPLFATVAASSNGDNTIIAAVVGKRIRILNGLVLASAQVNIFFRDAPGGTAITGTMNAAANGGFQIPYSPIGNFQTSTSNALVLNLSGAIAVGGWLTYITL